MMTTANSKELTPRQRGVPNHQSRSSKSFPSSESTTLPTTPAPSTKSNHRHPSKSHSSDPTATSMKADHGSKLPSKVSNELSTLKLLFTQWTEEDLLNALEDVGGDLDTAIGRIGEGEKISYSIFHHFTHFQRVVIFGIALVVLCVCVSFLFLRCPSATTYLHSPSNTFALCLSVQFVNDRCEILIPFPVPLSACSIFPDPNPFRIIFCLGHAAQWAPVAKREKKPVSLPKSIVNTYDSTTVNSSRTSPSFRPSKEGGRGGRGGGNVSRGGIRGGRGGSRGGYAGKKFWLGLKKLYPIRMNSAYPLPPNPPRNFPT